MFLFIDNYDSFSYNLVQAFMQLGRTPVVVKNDDPALVSLADRDDLAMVCISPGPGRPESAGRCLEFLQRLPARIPVLGVCLGHQILGSFAGARVEVGPRIMHGKQSCISHDGTGIFHALPQSMPVARYHSLVVRAEDAPDRIRVTAGTDEHEVMALQYKDRPWAGVQFHPESVLTPDGMRLLANFPSGLITTGPDSPTHIETINPGRIPVRTASIIEQLASGEDLPVETAMEAFSRLMDGELSASQAGALLLGLRAKGETPEEMGAAVRAVLSRAVPVPPVDGTCIDIVGTGGDNKSSFNCSTATCLTLAGMGHGVLKHGNRSVSSRCGSADVLEKLGIPLDTPPEAVPATLDRDKFVFLFAPRYHPAFSHVMPVRRELGVRTLFNLLGPLVNPAKPTHHFLGVPGREQLYLVAETLARTSNGSGAVVCGAGGYDELTTMGPASLMFVDHGDTRSGCLDPEEYGFSPCREEDLVVSDPDEAAAVLRQLLQGEGPDAMRDMLMLNVGFALYLLETDRQETIDPCCGYNRSRMHTAMERARQAVQDGAGRRFCHA